MGDRCLFPHRGDKGVLVTKTPKPTDGKAGATAATAPSPKVKAAAKKTAAAEGAAAPEADA